VFMFIESLPTGMFPFVVHVFPFLVSAVVSRGFESL
jgi:hypothetical protein